jgi:hypothetical protein
MGQRGVGAVAFLGLVSAVFVLVALATALVVGLRRPWTRIAVRVIGSRILGRAHGRWRKHTLK